MFLRSTKIQQGACGWATRPALVIYKPVYFIWFAFKIENWTCSPVPPLRLGLTARCSLQAMGSCWLETNPVPANGIFTRSRFWILQTPRLKLKVHSILTAPDGSLLLRMRRRHLQVERRPVRIWGPNEGVEDDNWQSLYLSSGGDLWALGSKHIVMLAKGASTFQNRSIPEMLNPDSLNTIAEDPQGRVLTSSGKQLLRWEDGAWRTFNERQGLPPYGMAPVFVNPAGDVWFAVNGHGLSRWLGYNLWETWTTAEGLQSDTIWGLLRDRTGRLWVGNDNGLDFFEPGAKRFMPWPLPGLAKEQRVSGLAETHDGAIWVGAGSTVFRIDVLTRKTSAVACPGSFDGSCRFARPAVGGNEIGNGRH